MIEKTTTFSEKIEKLKDTVFVYEGDEVILTGRVAVRTLPSGRTKELYEIEQKNKTPYGNSKNKWVAITDLFAVQ